VEAQTLTHAATRGGVTEVEGWASREATGTGLGWAEFLAGAGASVLAVHALIAAAADPSTTPRDAERIDAAYLWICALTMLDSLADREHDVATGELSYVDLYESAEQMARRLALVASGAAHKARTLPNAAHHALTLAGVVAYYTSALSSRSAFSPSVTKPIRDELRPIMTPTLALMRAWRVAKRVRARVSAYAPAPPRSHVGNMRCIVSVKAVVVRLGRTRPLRRAAAGVKGWSRELN
jgi:hypothetical protein